MINYSHLRMSGQNESMDEAEYMYRPALGEFAPSPTTGKFEILEALKPHEIGNTAKLSVGHALDDIPLTPGEIVESHPINSKPSLVFK